MTRGRHDDWDPARPAPGSCPLSIAVERRDPLRWRSVPWLVALRAVPRLVPPRAAPLPLRRSFLLLPESMPRLGPEIPAGRLPRWRSPRRWLLPRLHWLLPRLH